MNHQKIQNALLGCVIATMLSAGIVGCGDKYPKCVRVGGRITYHGKPVKMGMVSFVQTGNEKEGGLLHPATGDIKSDGSYAMQTFRSGDGVLPGDYAVTITAFDYGSPRDEQQRLPSLVPAKYGSPQTSGLKATVPADAWGSLQMDFDLKD